MHLLLVIASNHALTEEGCVAMFPTTEVPLFLSALSLCT